MIVTLIAAALAVAKPKPKTGFPVADVSAGIVGAGVVAGGIYDVERSDHIDLRTLGNSKPAVTPEPGTWLSFSFGSVALVAWNRRRKRL